MSPLALTPFHIRTSDEDKGGLLGFFFPFSRAMRLAPSCGHQHRESPNTADLSKTTPPAKLQPNPPFPWQSPLLTWPTEIFLSLSIASNAIERCNRHTAVFKLGNWAGVNHSLYVLFFKVHERWPDAALPG